MTTSHKLLHYHQRAPFWVAKFSAMACPCELLIATPNKETASYIANIIANEVWRIEAKYSRYTDNGITAAINTANGNPIDLDDETTQLFQYAQTLFELSEGLFDISSGCLKNIWAFHKKKTISQTELPHQSQIEELLPLIGLNKTVLEGNKLTLLPEMQIDLGGIGKEYAADKSLLLAEQAHANVPILINLGGDIVANKSLVERPWCVGISDTQANSDLTADETLTFVAGAVTTSGTSQRQWHINGKSYSHLINPKTGWPIVNPPLSVTVAAPTCMQAGMLSTLVMLQGENAEHYAKQEQIQCWIHR